jgi:hypothetical protein
VGTAVPRDGSIDRDRGGRGVIIIPGGYYPWGYGGLGFGGYYGGGYYDPWYGYPGYGYGGGYYGGGFGTYVPSRSDDDGAIRLSVKPREASVYVDGYYAGKVDDFDGRLQRLHLSAGPHRIEVRLPSYESLAFDVRIEPDQTITYHGDLKKLP